MERHAKQILEIYHEHIKICIKGKSSVCRTAQGEDRYKHTVGKLNLLAKRNT